MTLMFFALMACGSTSPKEPVKTETVAVQAPSAADAAVPTHDPEKVAEALKLADLADGVEDHRLFEVGERLAVLAIIVKELASPEVDGGVDTLLFER